MTVSNQEQPLATETLEPDDPAVKAHVRKVIDSPPFRAAPTSRRLLEYLIAETAAGRGDKLKGYAIGVDVFGKSPDYDAATDSTVRVQVRRLRQILSAYYASDEAEDGLQIDIPVGSYAVRFLRSDTAHDGVEGADADCLPVDRSQTSSFMGWTTKAALLLALVSVATFAYFISAVMAGPPLVYVAPFRAGDSTPETQMVSTGVQRDLIAQMGQYPNINVVGLESSQVPIEEARELDFLDADYVLKGVVVNEGSSLKISSALVSADDGYVLWSESTRVDIQHPADILAAQALIASKVGANLGQPQGVIEQVASARLSGTSDITFNDYACVLSAHDYLRLKNAESHLKARSCLERVVKENPNYSDAWALLSWIYGDEARLAFNVREDSLPAERALYAAEKAVAANPKNPLAHENLAVAQFYMLQTDEGESSIERAVRLSPNDPDVLATAGWNLALIGDHKRARALLDQAIEHNPNHPAWYWGGLALSSLSSGDYSDAVKYARRYNDSTESIVADYILAAAERSIGNDPIADSIIEEVARRYPGGGKPENAFVRRNRIPEFVVKAAFGKGNA